MEDQVFIDRHALTIKLDTLRQELKTLRRDFSRGGTDSNELVRIQNEIMREFAETWQLLAK